MAVVTCNPTPVRSWWRLASVKPMITLPTTSLSSYFTFSFIEGFRHFKKLFNNICLLKRLKQRLYVHPRIAVNIVLSLTYHLTVPLHNFKDTAAGLPSYFSFLKMTSTEGQFLSLTKMEGNYRQHAGCREDEAERRRDERWMDSLPCQPPTTSPSSLTPLPPVNRVACGTGWRVDTSRDKLPRDRLAAAAAGQQTAFVVVRKKGRSPTSCTVCSGIINSVSKTPKDLSTFYLLPLYPHLLLIHAHWTEGGKVEKKEVVR